MTAPGQAGAASRSKLFTPGRIGPVALRNRVIMPPMTTRLADDQGFVTEATIAYFQARAEGGAGMVTVEMASPEKAGRHRAREMGIYDDRFLPGLTRLVAAIHATGAKASIQLGHAGGHTREDICGEPPVAPSAVPQHVYEVTGSTIVPLAMTPARIDQCIAAFAAAAARARAAGFDCIELHAAHGYLMAQFLCPEENLRDDAYGGSIENRARFSLEALRAMRRAAPDAGLIFRFSAEDLFPGGMTQAEGLWVARWAEQAGADALHVSAGHYRSRPSGEVMTPPMAYPQGLFLHYAERIKAAVTVPVIAVGRLGDPALAMAVVDEGRADFVALGRPLVADPQWVEKARAGLAVRPCLSCNTCVNEMRAGAQMGCLVNAAAGHEREFAQGSPPAGERIAVIGAGPAGLSYAYLAAPGNRLTLFERAPQAGGAFRDAAMAPRFQDVEAREDSLLRFIDQMLTGCRERGVDVRFNADPLRDPEALADYDRVVLATGARYRWGLGAWLPRLLRAGWGRTAWAKRLMASDRLRHWLYYDARQGTGQALAARLSRHGREVMVIGDAQKAGKSKEAIADAFRAALLRPRPPPRSPQSPTPAQ